MEMSSNEKGSVKEAIAIALEIRLRWDSKIAVGPYANVGTPDSATVTDGSGPSADKVAIPKYRKGDATACEQRRLDY